MAFEITITADAESQMRALRVYEQRVLEAATRLPDRPTTPTRAIKRLRPNPFAEYEFRAGDLRVLYSVEGNGEEFHGHQDSSPESPGSASARNAQ